MRVYKRMNKEEQFWRRVEKTEDCWLWTGAKNDKGYGQFRNGTTTFYAHRFSYELHNGNLGRKDKILHKCDNPACVNPEHLIVGTQTENIHDAMNKKRMHGHPLRNDEIKNIRLMHSTGRYRQSELARIFNACPSNISKIVNNRSRREVCYENL